MLLAAGRLSSTADSVAKNMLGGYAELAFALRTPDGESQSVNGVFITPELFRELAVQPKLGRAFADDDAIWGTDMQCSKEVTVVHVGEYCL